MEQYSDTVALRRPVHNATVAYGSRRSLRLRVPGPPPAVRCPETLCSPGLLASGVPHEEGERFYPLSVPGVDPLYVIYCNHRKDTGIHTARIHCVRLPGIERSTLSRSHPVSTSTDNLLISLYVLTAAGRGHGRLRTQHVRPKGKSLLSTYKGTG